MSFDGLTVNFAQQQHATVMVRGLRAVTDFENEIQLAHTNHALYPGIETVISVNVPEMELPFLHHCAGRLPITTTMFPSSLAPNVEAALKKKSVRVKFDPPKTCFVGSLRPVKIQRIPNRLNKIHNF